MNYKTRIVDLSIADVTDVTSSQTVALTTNTTLQLVRDQVRFTCVENGFMKNEKSDPYQSLFYKAALWYAQEEKTLIEALAGSPDSTR